MTATSTSPPNPPFPTGPPLPPLPPEHRDRTVRHPMAASSRWLLVVLALSGLLAVLALRTVAGGAAAVAWVTCLAVGLAVVGRVSRWPSRLALVAAVAVGCFLALRSSGWLIALDVVAVLVLFALACSSEGAGRFLDGRFAGLARRSWGAVVAQVTVPAHVGDSLRSATPTPHPSRRRLAVALLRGAGLALPVVLVLGVSLASADAVFASFIDVRVDPGSLAFDLVIVAAGAWVAAGFFLAATRPPVPHTPPRIRVGSVEAAVVLGALTVTYAAFAASRLLVTLRGPDYVIDTTGLTYAEYARSGFFQLLWVAAATVVVLLCVRSAVRVSSQRARRVLSALGAVDAALTLVVVHTAVVRLGLYEDAFGSTRLRFYSSAFAWWLGAVFVLVLVAFVLTGRVRREWLPPAIVASAVVALLLVNVADPDRAVARHNLDRARDGSEFDAGYALELSADATPVLLEALPELDPRDRAHIVGVRCWYFSPDAAVSWNQSQQRAADALARVCD